VERLAPLAGAARCAKHNFVFLEGVKAALTGDVEFENGWYEKQPLAGLRSMGRVWAGWALSQAWYRKEMYKSLGYSSLDDFLIAYWDGIYLQRDPNDLLAMMDTWQQADISANDTFMGDFEQALGAITARTFVMPGQTDMYFPPEDGEYEAQHIPNAEFRPIPSLWGHYAGGGKDPTGADTKFIDDSLRELLSA
jgi:homoserine O-acetyltransferase